MRVFITGGASGLGRALAERWARQGARVCIGDLHDARAAETLQSIQTLGGQGLYLRCDVNRLEDLREVADTLVRDWGGVDLVVNNAGIASAGGIDEESLQQWERVVQVNLLGVVRGCQVFTPIFKGQGHGYFVNIASLAGLTPMPCAGSYCATKAAVVALSETLRLELAAHRIGVSVICPSFFRTNLGESLGQSNPKFSAKLDRLFSQSPLSAADVADCVYRAVQRRQFMVLPHALGRRAHWLKRFLPNPLYLKMVEKVAGRFALRRSGAEDLPVGPVDVWLKQSFPQLRGTPVVTQCSGGVSNWTYRLQYENEDLVLRRPPAGTKARSAHDMGREFRLQKALKPVFGYVPEVLAHCPDESLIGAEFYVMRRIEGVIPGREMPISLSAAQARQLCHTMLDALVSLHQVDVQAAGLEHLGAGAGYARRQVEGWGKRYARARTWNVPGGERITAWLLDRLPQERICLTHNDFRLDNLVLDPTDPTRIVGILDWELAALGDPLMDLGNLLAYWVQADDDILARFTRRQPTHLPGMLTRREVVDYYCQRSGLGAEDFTFYEVYGLFRLSAIAQQIYYRYHHKQTRNPAFKYFWIMVNYLHWRCGRLM